MYVYKVGVDLINELLRNLIIKLSIYKYDIALILDYFELKLQFINC